MVAMLADMFGRSSFSPSCCPSAFCDAMPLKRSFSRLDPFVRGQIVGMRAAGAKREDIVKKVKKKDGRSPTIRAVDAVLAKHACDPQWHGGDSSAAGVACGCGWRFFAPCPCARTFVGTMPLAWQACVYVTVASLPQLVPRYVPEQKTPRKRCSWRVAGTIHTRIPCSWWDPLCRV